MAVVAVRDEGRVLATTVSALLSLSVEPPLILISLGASAQVLPFLVPGRAFAVSVLEAGQGRVASVFADAFPAGAPPFLPDGSPWVDGALVKLGCSVASLGEAADHHLVFGSVESAEIGEGTPLLRYRRAYHRLPPE